MQSNAVPRGPHQIATYRDKTENLLFKIKYYFIFMIYENTLIIQKISKLLKLYLIKLIETELVIK